jgi:hypothetical protein
MEVAPADEVEIFVDSRVDNLDKLNTRTRAIFLTFPAEATAANTASASAREIRTRTPVDLQHHYQLASPPPVVVAATLCNGLTLYAVPLSFTHTGCESRPGSSYD